MNQVAPYNEHLIADPVASRTAEPVVRQYLLTNATVLRLTSVRWKEIDLFSQGQIVRFRSLGGEADPYFREVLERLEPDYIERETNNLAYTNIPQGNRLRTHFYYRLTPEMQELINEQTLLWGSWDWKYLYGFEDPTFCTEAGGAYNIVGAVISHEPMIYVYADSEDFATLRRETGVEWEY